MNYFTERPSGGGLTSAAICINSETD